MKGGGFLGVAGGSWGRLGALLQHRKPPPTDPPFPDSTNPKISAFFNVTFTLWRSNTLRTIDHRTSWAPHRNNIKASVHVQDEVHALLFCQDHPLVSLGSLFPFFNLLELPKFSSWCSYAGGVLDISGNAFVMVLVCLVILVTSLGVRTKMLRLVCLFAHSFTRLVLFCFLVLTWRLVQTWALPEQLWLCSLCFLLSCTSRVELLCCGFPSRWLAYYGEEVTVDPGWSIT